MNEYIYKNKYIKYKNQSSNVISTEDLQKPELYLTILPLLYLLSPPVQPSLPDNGTPSNKQEDNKKFEEIRDYIINIDSYIDNIRTDIIMNIINKFSDPNMNLLVSKLLTNINKYSDTISIFQDNMINLSAQFDVFHENEIYRTHSFMTNSINKYSDTISTLSNDAKTFIISNIIFFKKFKELYSTSNELEKIDLNQIQTYAINLPIINIFFLTNIEKLIIYLKSPLDSIIYNTNIQRANDILLYIMKDETDINISVPLISIITEYISKNNNMKQNNLLIKQEYLNAIKNVQTSANTLITFFNYDKDIEFIEKHVNDKWSTFLDYQKNYKNCTNIANEIMKEYKSTFI